MDGDAYAGKVRAAIEAIKPAIVEVGQSVGWPATLDAVSTLLVTMVIAAFGADEARAVCGRLYQEVARIENLPINPMTISASRPADRGHS